jgi:hypothetical protein
MKWVLTLYVCSVLNGECYTPSKESFDYKKEYGTHYGCVRSGLGDSFEYLFSGDNFSADQVEKFKLYPKFTCITEKENKEDA